MEVSGLVDHLFRTEYGKAVSYLTNRFGSTNLELAEDSVQEALIKAMQTWPFSEVPQNPTGWILRVASNKMIDQLRRLQKQSGEEVPDYSEETVHEVSLTNINDDMVKMLFACCHPSLSAENQIILTLKILGGLSVREIANSLLKKEETIAKAYTRAKKKFRDQEIEVVVPSAHEVAARLEMVLKIIYLLFNEGYKSSEGTELIREDLCVEAVRLNHVLLSSDLCNTPATNALQALMLFHSSRFDARVNEKGEFIPLELQDRSLWNQELIREGNRYLDIAADSESTNDYVIQAAISSLHCAASSFESTNWKEILRLYDLQLKLTSSPVVRMNRVIPLEKVHGPDLALSEIESLEETGFFDSYYLFHAIKAEVQKNGNDIKAAKDSLLRAIELAQNQQEVKYLKAKLSDLSI